MIYNISLYLHLPHLHTVLRLLAPSTRLSVSVAKRILKVWLHIDFLYSFTAAYRREQKIIENMFEFVRKIREVKQAEFEQKHSLASNGIRDDNAAADDDDDGIEQPPLLFVNEMLKMYYRGETTLPELDEHLITMIVGVRDML